MNNIEFNSIKNNIFSADEKVNRLKEEFLIGSPTKESVLKEASALLNNIELIINICGGIKFKNLFEVFNSETTLKLIDNTYCDLKNFPQKDRKGLLGLLTDKVRYYYYAGKNEEDVRKLYSFLQHIQENAICIAEASKIITNCDDLVYQDEVDEFDEMGYIEYKCFQVFLLKYDDEYYVLSQPFLMQKDDNILMLQGTYDITEAKSKFNEMIDRLQKEYNVSLLKNNDTL